MFKTTYSFEQRREEGKRVFEKYRDRIPVICERNMMSSNLCPDIDKKKYLVPNDLTFGQFLFVIRKRLKLPSEKALFLFVEQTMPNNQNTMAELYSKFASPDYFMYITYSLENVFGMGTKVPL